MFREVAIVTFTAGMIGTSAATLVNSGDPAPAPPPAIERASEVGAPPAETTGGPKPKRDLVVVDPTGSP
jgi:hypothetical protein